MYEPGPNPVTLAFKVLQSLGIASLGSFIYRPKSRLVPPLDQLFHSCQEQQLNLKCIFGIE